eukprot:TRINITY_DN17021_c0_g1_i1.p1 TRINITY_DN17021_c0_g1~~TRINITY_DN17021_c0_g1_i1.p1  ORF type:complete len:271 (-),score=50.30 TRINITY_DN17021_c0_g1_i1:68-880(-)
MPGQISSVKGKVAVITGAASGIGLQIARAFARNGARAIVVADISTESGKDVVTQLESVGCKAKFVFCDVTKVEHIAAAIETAESEFGDLDIVVNNAGIAGPAFAFGQDTKNITMPWQKMVDINFTSMIVGTDLAIRYFRRKSQPGVVINVASMAGILPVFSTPVYGATKGGIVHFTRSLAYLKSENIRVNCLCPSYTDTPLVHGLGSDVVDGMKEQTGGLVDAKTVAKGAVELVQDKSKAGACQRITFARGIDYWPSKRATKRAKQLSKL